ncbi:TetR/AcrR family transcriptional regulator [Streptomyces triticagri]|uniref:TetR/AcrR family transcriptional regulator n=1 Tax=Streptomyces triticagri TaxID=2293568 RepID=A0A372M331_9ACTN|nr:TetR family transcriptional regulator [Streptomyces triticagri]RFU84717.1 TetR/AcrR family transcriptional regulator [Streptomyces triticagri]
MTPRPESTTRRPGRRPGPARSREDILRAAQSVFAARGYEGSTVREIARRADVDAALVHYFFGSKRGVFAAAVSDALRPAELAPAVLHGDPDGLAERMLRRFLTRWESPEQRRPMLAIIRSAVSNEVAAAQLSEFITDEVLGLLVGSVPADHAPVRATMVGSQLIGLIMVRYIVKVEPLASVDTETLVRLTAPAIQRYLTTDAPSGRSPDP